MRSDRHVSVLQTKCLYIHMCTTNTVIIALVYLTNTRNIKESLKIHINTGATCMDMREKLLGLTLGLDIC
jgi:hypothetical protein